MNLPAAVRCSGRVFEHYHFRQCTSGGKVMREGKMYCGIHDPVAVQARVDKRDAKWAAKRVTEEAKWAEARRVRARAELCVAACDWMTDAEVKQMALISRTSLISLLYGKL